MAGFEIFNYENPVRDIYQDLVAVMSHYDKNDIMYIMCLYILAGYSHLIYLIQKGNGKNTQGKLSFLKST